jgi:hypothetical protein
MRWLVQTACLDIYIFSQDGGAGRSIYTGKEYERENDGEKYAVFQIYKRTEEEIH